MPINEEDIIAGLEEGIYRARRRYGRWSNGYRLRVEHPLVVNIAGSLFERLPERESLRLEEPLSRIRRLSGAPPVRGRPRGGRRRSHRADIVLFNESGSPDSVVEVKRGWDTQACRADLNRLRDLVHTCGAQREGSLRYGFLAVFRQARNGKLNERIRNMERVVDEWSDGLPTTVDTRVGRIREREFSDGRWQYTSYCVAISLP